jgi:hypothetical protein
MLDRLLVRPGTQAGLAARDTGDRLGLEKAAGEARLDELSGRIDALQYRLFAEDRRSVLLVSRDSTPRARTASSGGCSATSTPQG